MFFFWALMISNIEEIIEAVVIEERQRAEILKRLM